MATTKKTIDDRFAPHKPSDFIDLGNNESASRGVFPQPDGTFLAMTFAASKTFKTRRGAERWLARRNS